jgi:SAM-dependent methyltransferase
MDVVRESRAAETAIRPIIHRLDRRWYPRDGARWDNRRFVEYVQPYLSSARRLVDFGAGRGVHPEFDFRPFVEHVVGVDVDRAVEGNRQVHEWALLAAPDYAIPSADESFDAIVATNVVEHLPNPRATFRELARVLRPGGVLLIKTTNRRHYVATIARLTPVSFHRWVNARRGTSPDDIFPTTYRCNTPGTLRATARAAALDVVDVTLHEGRPEYLRGNAATYLAGFLYERTVNATPALRGFRAVLFAALRKPDVRP